nr:MAG: hypothetical protein [uncultured archaeon]
MSFRNVSRRQDYAVIRTRSAKPSDEKKWHDIYIPQVGKFFGGLRKFAVANWIPVVVGITAGLGAAVLGFYIGQTYSTASIGKKLATRAVDLLPKKIQAQVRSYM